MTRTARIHLARLRPLLGLGLALLLGCSASSIRINPPSGGDEDTAVVVTVLNADTGAALGVAAVIIVGGERVTLPAGDDAIRVTNVPFGTADPPVQPLTVTARGFHTHFEELELNRSTDTPVTAQLQEADLDITGTVSGTITNHDSGNPLTSVVVEFTPDIPGAVDAVKGATDKDGEYTVGGIPTGATVAKAVAQGFLTNETQTLVVQDAGSAGNGPLDFAMVATSSKVVVRGRVLDLISRDPIPDASVEVGGEGPELTDANGRFQVTQVPVGDQPISVTAQDYDAFSDTISIAPGLPDLQIELAPSSARPPPSPATIRGTVTIRNNPDNAGATVKAISTQSGQVIDTAITDANGDYGLFVPAGRYRIEVSFQGVVISKTVDLGGAGRTLTGVDFQITAP